VFINRLAVATWSGWDEVSLNGLTPDAPARLSLAGRRHVPTVRD